MVTLRHVETNLFEQKGNKNRSGFYQVYHSTYGGLTIDFHSCSPDFISHLLYDFCSTWPIIRTTKGNTFLPISSKGWIQSQAMVH